MWFAACLTLEGTELLLAAFCQQITTGNGAKKGETHAPVMPAES